MIFWTVYDHPKDFPNSFVARKFEIVEGEARPTQEYVQNQDLEAIRDILSNEGLSLIPRDLLDDVKIVEVWM